MGPPAYWDMVNGTTRLLRHLVNGTTRLLGHQVNGTTRLLGHLVNETIRLLAIDQMSCETPGQAYWDIWLL